MRKLASIVTIETKSKMFEKDKICVATFNELGYEAIIPVTCNIGDKMVFIQEGSILPESTKWEFLRKRCYREDLNGFLIKPMLMGAKDIDGQKGDRVKSWGLCVTLEEAGLSGEYNSGDDVTQLLGIKKYDPQEEKSPASNKAEKKLMKYRFFRWIVKLIRKIKVKNDQSRKFPSDVISKSDETTIQNCKSIISTFNNRVGYVTAKMEGQSFTCSLDLKTKKFYVCSRNNRYNSAKNSDAHNFFEAAAKYDIANKLKEYYKKTGVILVVQGEQCGPGIQSNIYNFDSLRWFVFRIKGYQNKEWVEYNYDAMIPIVEELGLELVPLVEKIDDMYVFKDVDSLEKYAEKVYWTKDCLLYTNIKENEKLWVDYMQHEGIVIKSDDCNKEKNIGFSFKVKNLEYAEKGLPKIANCVKKCN